MKTRRGLFKKFFYLLLGLFGISTLMAGIHKLLSIRFTTGHYPIARREDKAKELYDLTDQSIRLIRPPGAVAEDKFLAGCIRCTRCQDACDVGAIQLLTESYGKYAYTPYVDPVNRGCTLCMKCTDVCPVGVLKKLTVEQRDQVDMASVEFRQDLCLSYKAKRIRNEQGMLMELGQEPTESVAPTERRGPCGECYMFCPQRKKAITLEPGSFLAPNIHPDQCIGCGLCEEICRTVVRGEPAIKLVAKRKFI